MHETITFTIVHNSTHKRSRCYIYLDHTGKPEWIGEWGSLRKARELVGFAAVALRAAKVSFQVKEIDRLNTPKLTLRGKRKNVRDRDSDAVQGRDSRGDCEPGRCGLSSPKLERKQLPEPRGRKAQVVRGAVLQREEALFASGSVGAQARPRGEEGSSG